MGTKRKAGQRKSVKEKRRGKERSLIKGNNVIKEKAEKLSKPNSNAEKKKWIEIKGGEPVREKENAIGKGEEKNRRRGRKEKKGEET